MQWLFNGPHNALKAFSHRCSNPVEIHRMPGLFEVLRGIIDERRHTGQRFGHFLLLGSASLDLMQQSSLASGLGVSSPAVERYIDLLVDLQLVRRSLSLYGSEASDTDFAPHREHFRRGAMASISLTVGRRGPARMPALWNARKAETL